MITSRTREEMQEFIKTFRGMFKVTCSYCKRVFVSDKFITYLADDWNYANNVNHWEVFCNDRCLFLFKLKGKK